MRATRPAKIARGAGLAALVLSLGLGAAACGGGSDGPLSAKELCSKFDSVDDDATIGEALDSVKDLEYSDEIPKDVQDGMETFVGILEDLPSDTSGDDLDSALAEEFKDGPDPDVAQQVQAFLTWTDDNCD